MSLLPDQPPPQPGQGDVWLDAIEYATEQGASPAILDLMRERREVGIERYGTPLQVGNGREALLDGLQEALDGYAYAVQAAATHRRWASVLVEMWWRVVRVQYEACRAAGVL